MDIACARDSGPIGSQVGLLALLKIVSDCRRLLHEFLEIRRPGVSVC